MKRVDTTPPADVPELWFADPPSWSLVIDQSGGNPLAALTMAEAMKLFRKWWRWHRDQYRADQAAIERRRQMRSLR